MDLLQLMKNRRSIRKYSSEKIEDETLNSILKAGLLAPSGKNIKPWELIVVREKDILKKMSECRVGAAKMLEGADTAIVVIADENKTDVWIEDSSIVMTQMHLMADSLGVGSCWIQGRLRETPEKTTTEEFLRELLQYPDNYKLEAILSLGMPESHPEAKEVTEELWTKVHWNKY